MTVAAPRAPLDDAAPAIAAALDALTAGDAAAALAAIDTLPPDAQPDLLAEVWILAGSLRALRPLLPSLSPAARARADAFIAAPTARNLPSADGPDAYATLARRAADLSRRGLAADLVMTHLALSDAAPRADWRVVHIEHAGSLALGLDDPALSDLVRAYEALRDAELGEHADAREAATEALASPEPRARAIAARALAMLPPLDSSDRT